MSTDARGSIKISFEPYGEDELFISDLDATVDIESGGLLTQAHASFEPATPYRESIISQPLVALESSRLPSKDQIIDYVTEVPSVSNASLLTRFDIVSCSDTNLIDTSLQYGKPIFTNYGGGFISSYYRLPPQIALHAIFYQNYMTEKLEIKLLFDPSSTRLNQFYDSYYNEKWRSVQIAKIKTMAHKLSEFLSRSQLSQINLSELSDEDWGNLEHDLEMVIRHYLTADQRESITSFRSEFFRGL